MGDRINNRVTISGSSDGPIVQTGHNSGTLIVGSPQATVAAQDLAALLIALRSQAAQAQLDKASVVEDNLDDLIADAQAPEVAIPAVVQSRWTKVKGLLGGLTEFTDLIAKISDHIHRLFG
ncbi:hypothetical protein SAMN05421504_103791 [Amycolatopsis xylanica]|uniref:Uncharacterized protein n=1 Tax=Amycolatopsis xylanica TaxID=589385 RepID=A0A1H3EF84_9PSEU|nr:hypothetical protein [Amycolatopsis xylanica]SDX77277.1 hypothetical protein SAMN05421504_103791 [Amycolatopsis xylanica]